MATVLLDANVEIPTIRDLAGFRHWALSDRFPDRGRVDYIAGRLEIDMSPEDLFTHGTLKTEIAGEIKDRVDELGLGHTFVAETRVSSVPGQVSTEPDVVVIGYESLDSGRVRFTPKASSEQGRHVEIEGGPDLIVEIVSDSSVEKDTQRLPTAYFLAGLREYWLIDARGADVLFQIHHRGPESFLATSPDDEGFQQSDVLSGRYRLDRDRHQRGHWVYRLRLR